MLKFTGEFNSNGEKLYRNMMTGDVSIMEHAEFIPSQRKYHRKSLDKFNNRRATPGRIVQTIRVRNSKGKEIGQSKVFHLTANALFRKAVLFKRIHGIK